MDLLFIGVCVVVSGSIGYFYGRRAEIIYGRAKHLRAEIEIMSRAIHMKDLPDHPAAWEKCPAEPCSNARKILEKW